MTREEFIFELIRVRDPELATAIKRLVDITAPDPEIDRPISTKPEIVDEAMNMELKKVL